MRKLLGHLAACAALGVLLATTVTSEAKGGSVTLMVTITDDTTAATSTFTIVKGGAFDGSNPADPNTIITNGTFQTTSSGDGVMLSGITASTNNPGSTSATLSLGGTAQV